ncbi:TrkH family potassium uptake protein [Camelliibacillus cellulosilyticus]|uniref:TrkH family potassium uptake protein n=1 Tax=Camelliibacillus cellulosilyticus TaxID=2174486 RepID=A0ABV9GN82_9BACL
MFYPAQILALVFILSITIGACLFKLPISHKEPITWLDAFFTATSATTSTGLMTVFNGDAFTPFGNIILLILIQIGGLGVMTFATLIFLLIDRPISMKQRIMMQEALNQSSLGGILKLVRRLLIFSLLFEGVFTLVLAIRFIPQLGFWRGFIYAGFNAVSAFNNAGVTLWPDNLIRYVHDPIVNFAICALIILGGIGFTVLNDIWDKKKWREFGLHTKLMLIGTVVINIIAFLIIFAIEFNNGKTIGHMDIGHKGLAAFFQTITSRSAGFSTVDIGLLEPATQFFMMMLMFIGAGSVSTGGGIKLSTFICLMAMVIAYIRRQNEPVFMERTIPRADIFKALAITLIGGTIIFIGLFLLLLTENGSLSFSQLTFEAVSAFGTVGLSTGITAQLSAAGQIVLALMMIFGKLGPLTVMFALARDRGHDAIRYPRGKLFIG